MKLSAVASIRPAVIVRGRQQSLAERELVHENNPSLDIVSDRFVFRVHASSSGATAAGAGARDGRG